MRTSLNPEAVADRRARVASMTAAGYSASQIAVALRVTVRTVVRMRSDLGIAQAPGTPLTAVEHQVAREMFDDGCSYAEVARTVGHCPSTLRHHYPGHGWPPQACGELAAALKYANRRLKAVSA